MRVSTVLVLTSAIVMLLVGSLTAQTQAPSYAPPVPGAPPVPAETISKSVEGTVTKLDPAAKSVQVSSGPLGLGGATMAVTDETKITVQGKEGSLQDIHEGAKVKASYESRGGQNVAKSIEVMSAGEKEALPARPGPGSLPGGAPAGAQPKTQ